MLAELVAVVRLDRCDKVGWTSASSSTYSGGGIVVGCEPKCEIPNLIFNDIVERRRQY